MKRSLSATAMAVTACAALGSIASRGVRSPWYAALRKPSWQPPPAAFPVAWTTLYTDIALSSAVALDRLRAPADGLERPYARALGLNLTLNTGWSWAFFAAQRTGLATVVAAALTVSSTDLVRRTWEVDRRAGAALAPYAAWCSFATALSAAIWQRNR